MRVEIVSDSHIVREGLVGLVAALGEAAIVVDDVSNDAENRESTNRDVTLLDLGAVDGLTAYERLRNTCRRGVPVIGLVYDQALSGGFITSGLIADACYALPEAEIRVLGPLQVATGSGSS